MSMYEIGSRHQTKHNGILEVVGYVDYSKRIVQFIDTGYVTEASVNSIRNGSVKDPFVPSVCDVGYLGEHWSYDGHPLKGLLQKRWSGIVTRCCLYGYKPLDPEWHCFATFMRDALELKGNELLYQHSKENRIDLDSDIIPIEKGIPSRYSKETCQWVPHAVNIRHQRHPLSHITIPRYRLSDR